MTFDMWFWVVIAGLVVIGACGVWSVIEAATD
jgi:hypothetical protein